jgi:adenylate cyclase
MKRKIAVILVAEAPGFSGRLAADRAAAMSDLDAARALFHSVVSAHDGRIFNAAGASILAEFASVVEAVRCALSVQHQLVTTASPLGFKIGLTVGDIVEHEGDLLGDGVNVAARLAGLVPDGGVCVSRSVYEQVRTKVDVSAADLGLQALKNIPEPVHALALKAGFDGKVPDFDRPKGAQKTGALLLAGAAGLGLLIVILTRPGAAPQTAAVNASTSAPVNQASDRPTRVPNASSSSAEFETTKRSQRCGEILERVQTGAASADDRALLASRCQ